MSGIYLMLVAIAIVMMLTGIITSALQDRQSYQDAARFSDRDETFAALNSRLDTVMDRLATVEKIITDEDRILRRKFSKLDRNDT